MLMTKTSPANRNNGLWHSVVFVALVVLVVRSHAQPPILKADPVKKVIITMTGSCDAVLGSPIQVVLTVGGVTESFNALRGKPGEPWVGVYPHGQSFAPARARASLRLGTSRTDCVQPEAWTKEDARFSFHCNQRRVRAVEFKSEGPIEVIYSRKIASVACPNQIERQPVTAADDFYKITDIWIKDEELSIQLGADLPKPPEALLVFSLDAKSMGLPVFSRDPQNSELLVFRDSRGRQHKQKTVDELSLNRQDVVNFMVKQHFAKIPKIEENLGAYYNKRFEDVGLDHLTWKVK